MTPLIVCVALAAFFLINSNGSAGADAPEAQGGSVYFDPPVKDGPHNGNPSDPQIAAFLALIRSSEGTAQYPDPWGTYYGGAQFTDKSAHPCEARADGSRVCQPTDLGNGSFSTAAGAYQITLTTWNAYGGTAHYGDFSNASQDQCAADIIAACGGADLIASGNISGAQTKLASQWASFTSANVAANNSAFQSAGGNLTA